MTTTSAAFQVHALPAEVVEAVRSTGLDAAGISAERLAASGGEPPHARSCAGPEPGGAYPQGWRGRPQVLRAYDRRGHIHEATLVHDGTDPDHVIAGMLAHPDVVQVHSCNVAYGCFMFVVTRPGG